MTAARGSSPPSKPPGCERHTSTKRPVSAATSSPRSRTSSSRTNVGIADATTLVASLDALAAKDASDLPIGGVEQAANDWRTESSKEIEAVREGNQPLAESLVATGIAKVTVRHSERPTRSARRSDLESARPDPHISRRRSGAHRAGVRAHGADGGRGDGGRGVSGAEMAHGAALVNHDRRTAHPQRRARSRDASGPTGAEAGRGRSRRDAANHQPAARRRDPAREAIEQSAILAVQVRSALASDLGDYPDGWTMAAGLRAAEGVVAGDCYDVALISPTTIGIIVLDIAGHGAQSAIAALKCKELLKAALRSDLEPGAHCRGSASRSTGSASCSSPRSSA